MKNKTWLLELVICDIIHHSNLVDKSDFCNERIRQIFGKFGARMIISAKRLIDIETEYGFNPNLQKAGEGGMKNGMVFIDQAEGNNG